MLLGNRKEDWMCVCVPELVWATQSRGPRKMLAKVLFRPTWHNTLNDSTVCPWAVAVEGAFNGATRELPVLWHLQISHVEDAWGSSSHKEACMPTMLYIATYPREHTQRWSSTQRAQTSQMGAARGWRWNLAMHMRRKQRYLEKSIIIE